LAYHVAWLFFNLIRDCPAFVTTSIKAAADIGEAAESSAHPCVCVSSQWLLLRHFPHSHHYQCDPISMENTKGIEGETKMSSGNIYVIQRHAATRLHYDLRLEMDGVLKSWAVPKEPPVKPGVRRLAVEVEDHPVDYADFEGIIPEGEYGAGTVEIWDKGTYKLIDKKESKLIVDINGEKLKGAYVLVRFKGPKNWLFFKKK